MSGIPTRWLFVVFVLALLSPCLPTGSAVAAARAQDPASVTLGPRGDATQSGVMSGHGPASEPTIRWDVQTGEGIPNSMAIHNELLFYSTGSPGVIGAIDRTGGDSVWTVEFGAKDSVFSPEIAGDLLLVSVGIPSGNDAVIALDAATGAERWRIELDNPGAVTHLNGTVYVPMKRSTNEENSVARLVALNANTGSERWSYSDANALDFNTVAVSDGIAVATSSSLVDDGVGAYAFDAESGALLWTFTEGDSVHRPAAISNGIAVIQSLPNVWAVDLRSGETVWNVQGASSGGGVAVSPETAYIGFRDEVRAVNLLDGTTRWSSPVNGIAGAPTIAGDVLYTGVWRTQDNPGPHHLHAFDAASGAGIWSLQLEHYITVNHPLAVDGMLYVDANKSIVAFGDPSQGDSTPAEPVSEPGSYTSPEFGHTIEWSAPWEFSQPQSSSAPGQDFFTLMSGDATLALRVSSNAGSPEMYANTYATDAQSREDAEVAVTADGPDFSRAVARYTVDGTSYIEYVEVRSLPGDGLFLTVLRAPASMFQLAHLATQQLVSVDQQPPFRAAPVLSGA